MVRGIIIRDFGAEVFWIGSGGQDNPKVECWVRPQGFTALAAFHVFANDQTSSAHANFLKPGQPEMST